MKRWMFLGFYLTCSCSVHDQWHYFQAWAAPNDDYIPGKERERNYKKVFFQKINDSKLGIFIAFKCLKRFSIRVLIRIYVYSIHPGKIQGWCYLLLFSNLNPKNLRWHSQNHFSGCRLKGWVSTLMQCTNWHSTIFYLLFIWKKYHLPSSIAIQFSLWIECNQLEEFLAILWTQKEPICPHTTMKIIDTALEKSKVFGTL